MGFRSLGNASIQFDRMRTKLSESGYLGQLASEINKLWAAVRALKPAVSVGVLTSQTGSGVFRQAKPQATSGPSGDKPVWL